MAVELSDRVELGSPGWLDLTRNFLEQRVPSDTSFSLCEVYTGAPPHLSETGGRLAWTAQADQGRVEVGFGEHTNVDLHIEGPYDTICPLATSVYDTDAEQRQVLREHAHVFGRAALTLRGELPQTPGLLELLGEMHNHLARHTINNPDVAHRLKSLDLQDQAAEIETQGYTILENALSERTTDALREAIVAEIESNDPPSQYAAMLLERGRIFEQTALHPWVTALAEHTVGRGCLLAQSIGIRRQAGESGLPLHSDYNLIREPFPPYGMNLTTIWALEDFTLDSGPTLIMPGTNQLRRHPTSEEHNGEATKIVMPKGSVAMWDGATWHAQSVRETPGERITLHNTYSRLILRTYDNYLGISPDILERNPPAFTTLCGHDDLFDKNTYRGPDYRRLVHSAQLFEN